jgi:hypothetical protein
MRTYVGENYKMYRENGMYFNDLEITDISGHTVLWSLYFISDI